MEAQMEQGIELRQPHWVDVQCFAKRFREWTLTASLWWSQAGGDKGERSFTADEATDRQPEMMIRPSMHERVALACRRQKRGAMKSVGHLPLFLGLVCALASPATARADDRTRTKDLPLDVTILVDRVAECRQLLSGKFTEIVPESQVERDVRLLRCDYLAFDIAVLRGKYRRSPRALHALGDVGVGDLPLGVQAQYDQ